MSCGCSTWRGGSWRTKHRKTKSQEWNSWFRMIDRCQESNVDHKSRYFDRGIKVCDRWVGDFGFDNFLADMGACPGKGYTIDRIDNDKGYYKENCRWANNITQQRNRCNNKLVEIDGITACVTEHAQRIGITHYTLYQRMKNGWPPERLSEPARAYPKGTKKPRQAVHSSSP